MSILLGNVSIEGMEKRLGINFPDELKILMSESRQEDVSKPIAEGKWHCFDIPFVLVCGGEGLTKIVHEYLAPLSSQMKKSIRIATSNKKEKHGNMQ